MYALITVSALYYDAPLLTFSTHRDAWIAGRAMGGWFDIEEIVPSNNEPCLEEA